MNLILIGAQGSGKGTQSQILQEKLRLKPCASGDLLREEIEKQTPLGKAAKPYYDSGNLVPDELVIEMILTRLENLDDGCEGIILDGFPRTIPQAAALDERLGRMGQRIDSVVYLEVPRAMLEERLSGRYICRAHGHVWNIKTHPPTHQGICDYDGSPLYQRSDDTPEKIARRLDIFFEETIQLVDYYRRLGKLLQVDGTGEIEAVSQAIIDGVRAGAASRIAASGRGDASESRAS